MKFIITTKNNKGEEKTLNIAASDYAHASIIAAQELFPNLKVIQVRRMTGDVNKSGHFQAYAHIGHGVLSSHGEQYHVRKTKET